VLADVYGPWTFRDRSFGSDPQAPEVFAALQQLPGAVRLCVEQHLHRLGRLHRHGHVWIGQLRGPVALDQRLIVDVRKHDAIDRGQRLPRGRGRLKENNSDHH
jgi:hypothetical protein